MKVVFTCMLVVLSTACNTVPSEPKEPEKPLKLNFTVAENYQRVYINILRKAKECIQSRGITQILPEGTIMEEIKSATINIAVKGPFGVVGNFTHTTILIDSLHNDSTTVQITNTFKPWDIFANAMQDWAIDQNAECPEYIKSL